MQPHIIIRVRWYEADAEGIVYDLPVYHHE